MKKKHYKNKKLIRNLLTSAGFSKDKVFLVREKNGVLVVRFDKKVYE